MTSRYLYDEDRLPDGFVMPVSFVEFVNSEARPDLEPWWFLCDYQVHADFWMDELRKQYPGRVLVPFAKLEDTDDVACFDGTDLSPSPRVVYVHAFASPGWEARGEVKDFFAWLAQAINDHEVYVSERGE